MILCIKIIFVILLQRLSGGINDLNIAKLNLPKINYILVLENINNDIMELNKELNKYFKVDFKFKLGVKNKNKNKYQKEVINYELKNRLKKYCENDIILYDLIKKKKC